MLLVNAVVTGIDRSLTVNVIFYIMLCFAAVKRAITTRNLTFFNQMPATRTTPSLVRLLQLLPAEHRQHTSFTPEHYQLNISRYCNS